MESNLLLSKTYYTKHVACIFSVFNTLFFFFFLIWALLKILFYFIFFGCNARHVGSYFPSERSNRLPLRWKHEVLTTGLPGKSLNTVCINLIHLLFLHPLTSRKEMSDFTLKRHRYNTDMNIY